MVEEISRVPNTHLLFPILSQINLVLPVQPHFMKFHFYITRLCKSMSLLQILIQKFCLHFPFKTCVLLAQFVYPPIIYQPTTIS